MLPVRSKTNSNLVRIEFKGEQYLCTADSHAADTLNRANRAWFMGYDSLADVLFDEAQASGCHVFDMFKNTRESD